MPQNNDVKFFNLVMPYIVAPSRLELDDNISYILQQYKQ